MSSSNSTPSSPAPDDKWAWVAPACKFGAVAAVCATVGVGAKQLNDAKVFKVLPGALSALVHLNI